MAKQMKSIKNQRKMIRKAIKKGKAGSMEFPENVLIQHGCISIGERFRNGQKKLEELTENN